MGIFFDTEKQYANLVEVWWRRGDRKNRICPNFKPQKIGRALFELLHVYPPEVKAEAQPFLLKGAPEDVLILTEKFPSPDASIFVWLGRSFVKK